MITLETKEAEQALLGALLWTPSLWHGVAATLKAEHFSDLECGSLFAEISRRNLAGEAPDAVMLSSFCDYDRLIGLQEKSAGIDDLPGYSQTIRDAALRRQLCDAADRLKLKAHNVTEPQPSLMAEIMGIFNSIDAGDDASLTEHEVITRIVERMQLKTGADSTGLTALDRAMGGGLYTARTYGIAAREKRGKTTLAHSISYNLNTNGVCHAYVALEMGREEIVQRQVARTMRINSLKLVEQQTDELAAEVAKAGLSRPNNVVYTDLPGASFDELKSEVARIKLRHPIRGIILDYWQLVTGKEKSQTEEAHLRAVAQWCADFAKKHNVWMIVIAQLNEDGNLFAGRGLRKACDQLYYLMREENNDYAWLKMDSSRYTPLGDAGSETYPSLLMVKAHGPHFADQYVNSY